MRKPVKFVCPRCGYTAEYNRRAISRLTNEAPFEYVCSSCGVDEAWEQYEGRLQDWRPFRLDKQGV